MSAQPGNVEAIKMGYAETGATYFDSHPSPARSELKNPVAWSNAGFGKDMMDLSVLSVFEVIQRRSADQIALHATFFWPPQSTRVHHFLAKEGLVTSRHSTRVISTTAG